MGIEPHSTALIMQRPKPVLGKKNKTMHDEQGRLLTLHEDGSVGIQRLSKHSILRLKTQQRH